ncbi:flagellar basal-body MS-ring/collar protein FliF [Planctomonas psychrotolerans]|uniref:flagellar basal-body MS-ring/collar protein FliF n=1 Tax=Planctomonas psychrotolerans TaxID=2528712 RepID=UPI00123B9478|nr:flagellar basal-body MS-ring/collar protein FliF [Planctomonas psychrotolerans]
MPVPLRDLLGRVGTSVREFTIAQRTIALIGVAALVLGVVALSAWMAKPSYTPLFSGLQAADANVIVEQLRTDGVPYELTSGGGTILVPEESVYDQRLKAAAAGLPSSSTGGYSLLDNMGVTSSEFQQSVTYKRALEGELASTIGALDGVKVASVRLAIPEATVFVAETKDPTASVFVETDRGATLNADQVQAIVHLTSASIEGMTPENVAVIDAAGTVLSAVGSGATGGADKQAADYEQRVRGAVQTMLDRVVGVGNASVVVAATMSTESGERVEESFTTPEGAPALNESSTTEDYTGTGGNAAGVLGPDNIAVPGGANGDGTFTSESATRNNAVNKVTESTIIPAGAVARQTVSVALDSAAAGAVNVGNVSDLVAAAAGIDAVRGDVVTVEVMEFNRDGAADAAAALAAAEAAEAAELRSSLIRTAMIAAAIALPLIAALILVARRTRRNEREELDIGQLSGVPADWEGVTVPIAMTDVPPPMPIEPVSAPVPGPEAISMERKRAEIDALAERDPEKTAEFLRNLMDERQPV